MKIHDVQNKSSQKQDISEALPPHLAKLVGADGDWTPEVKARLGKGGERRLITQPIGSLAKDVTPKGYGPEETDESVVTEADNVHATYLFSMSKPDYENPANTDTKYVKMDFMVHPGGVAHPQALSRQIDENPTLRDLRKQGYINFKTVASWKNDLDSELADAHEKLNSGKNWLESYRQELQKKVDTLSQAKKIMNGNEVLEGVREAGVSPQDTIRKFLDQKAAQERRSADLAKNPQKINQFKSDELAEDSGYVYVDIWARSDYGDDAGYNHHSSIRIPVKPDIHTTFKQALQQARIQNPRTVKASLRWTDDKEYMLIKGKVYQSDWVDGKYAPTLIPKKSALKLEEYKPGITVLTRSITLEPDEISTLKKVRWPYGIEMSVRHDQVTFRTAKIKTLAKILNKYIDFGATDVGTVLNIPAEIGPIDEAERMHPADAEAKLRQIEAEYMALVRQKNQGDASPETAQKIQELKAQYKHVSQFKDTRTGAMGEARSAGAARKKARASSNIPFDHSKQNGKLHSTQAGKDKRAAGVARRAETSTNPVTEVDGYAANGAELLIAQNGKLVQKLKLPLDPKMHHIAQELRKLNLGLNDFEMTAAARDLAGGRTYRKDALAMQMKASTPTEMR
jgi:hypothetical protein